MKVFVLGRTGCGKSTAARYMGELAERRSWSVTRINDYTILRRMFQDAKTRAKFRETDYDGFDIVDFSVLNVALEEVKQDIQKCMLAAKQKELITIEFARDDYNRAMELLGDDVLRNAYFLFIDADVDACVQRVHERVRNPQTEDDSFVSDTILTSYFNTQNVPTYVGEERVRIINNMASLEAFLAQVSKFFNEIFDQEMHKFPLTPRDTDSLHPDQLERVNRAIGQPSGITIIV